MVALLGPLLAQLITLSVADRTEAREIVNVDTHAEASTRPTVAAGFGWKHASLTITYSPLFTLTPLQSDSRRLLVFQSGTVFGNYVLGRTNVFVGESVGYGNLNFQDQALAGGNLATTSTVQGAAGETGTNNSTVPVAIGTVLGGATSPGTINQGANGAPAQSQVRAEDRVVRYESVATTVGANHAVSQNLAYGGDLGYVVSGAVNAPDQADYPLVRGPRGSVFARYGWGHNDTISSSLGLQYSVASSGPSAWLGLWNETWTHRFSAHTTAYAGAGLGGTRSPVQDNGTVVSYSIYPTFSTGLAESTVLARGHLSLNVSVAAAPAVDLVTQAIDPRLSLGAGVAWARDRFFSALAVGSALSLSSGQNSGSLNAVSGALTFGYVLGKAVSVDTGVRGAYQSFAGNTVIPFTYAAFVGLNFGARLPLR